jgi:UDP:flavonoid glycosyltransferase YjiC (YdhE family)
MSSYLLCVCPIGGHVAPVLAVARHLVGAGHRVRMLTGSRFAKAVSATGAVFAALPEEADFDDRNLDAAFPERAVQKGIAAVRYDILHLFIAPGRHQYRALRQLLADEPTDAVLSDFAFVGILPMQLSGEPRPPLISLGVLPLSLSSVDTAPYGLGLPPSSSALGRLRNRTLNALVQRVILRPVSQAADQLLADLGLGSRRRLSLDAYPLLADRIVQFTVQEFEYPRSDLPAHLTFAGPLLDAAPRFELPSWWTDLDSGRPVVHVTQGTLDNVDLSKVIEPTITALADKDVLVVAATGGRPVSELRMTLPDNVRVAEMLPYGELLPRTDVMVTNGGYGGVQMALGHGVPLVVAGAKEDKPEVAGRVAWSGSGVNLRAERPKPDAIANAVTDVLAKPSYRDNARRLADAISKTDPLRTLDAILADVSARPSR